MALDYPKEPVLGEVWEAPNGWLWRWNGELWYRYRNDKHTHPLSDITDNGSMAYVDDAPDDEKPYVRKSETWADGTTIFAALAHESDFDNPHNVTLEQVGGSPEVHYHVEADISDLDKYNQYEVDHKDSLIQDDLDAHKADLANPHQVTYEQLGGTQPAPGPHTHVEVDITDLDKYTQAEVEAKDAVIQSELDAHEADKTNPHNVTLELVGGAPEVHTHPNGDLTGIVEDDHHHKMNDHDGLDGSGTVIYGDLLVTPLTFPPEAQTHVEL